VESKCTLRGFSYLRCDLASVSGELENMYSSVVGCMFCKCEILYDLLIINTTSVAFFYCVFMTYLSTFFYF
jgi:hypothetical protein